MSAVEKATSEPLDNEVEVREPSFIARFILDIDEQWPSLKFLGFGCYYAWIWLSYNSSILLPNANVAAETTSSVHMMYLVSTFALAAALILASIFSNASTRLVENRLFGVCMGLLAGVATVGTNLGLAFDLYALFIVCAVLTGLGTAWVALRLGSVYATVPARQGTMYVASSFIFACLLYFVAIGLPRTAGLVFTALLPVMAALFSVMMFKEDSALNTETAEHSNRPAPGFFVRFVLAIFIFAFIIGIIRGSMILTQTATSLNEEGSIIVFGTACVAVVIFLLVGLTRRDFNIGRFYYPVILVTAAAILITPLFGEAVRGVEGQVINIAYACFVMIVWCLLAHVSYTSRLSPVRVFGWGRGASALGTAVGWLFGSWFGTFLVQNTPVSITVSVVLVFVLFIVFMLIFNERQVNDVLHDASETEDGGAASQSAEGSRHAFSYAAEAPDTLAAEAEPDEDAWTRAARSVASRYMLSPREEDVLLLFSKGRTINFIAEELVISFNTAKTHVRHIYVKTGVHTRQELIDLIESEQD
ncbi:MAG: LuxR C-terminal-related transcriptional regulator [Coriobacteriaceae bacterium]|nr:LuxR C-terminal-related transcriptional regulator [Coriobacteriaceae bacterium]